MLVNRGLQKTKLDKRQKTKLTLALNNSKLCWANYSVALSHWKTSRHSEKPSVFQEECAEQQKISIRLMKHVQLASCLSCACMIITHNYTRISYHLTPLASTLSPVGQKNKKKKTVEIIRRQHQRTGCRIRMALKKKKKHTLLRNTPVIICFWLPN